MAQIMNKSLLFAIALTIVAVVWLVTGNIYGPNTLTPESSTAEQAGAEPNKQKPLFRVEVLQSEAQLIDDVIFLNGEIAATKSVNLRSELDGAISAIFFTKGDRVSVGAAIVNIDLGDRRERLQQAQADLSARESDIRATESLKAKKLISDNQYQQDLANLAAAKAAVKEIQVQIRNASIKAPFAGVINELPVEIGDYTSKGTEVATVVDDSVVKISVQVPQQHIAKIVLGATMQATLLSGQKYTGAIDFISTTANANTRTFTVEAAANRGTAPVFFGQSANIEIRIGEEHAHKLSPATLDLDTAGNLQVKLLDSENRVIAQEVEIVRSELDGVWLKGLPKSIRVITSGQGFVITGQQVEVVPSPLEKAESVSKKHQELETTLGADKTIAIQQGQRAEEQKS